MRTLSPDEYDVLAKILAAAGVSHDGCVAPTNEHYPAEQLDPRVVEKLVAAKRLVKTTCPLDPAIQHGIVTPEGVHAMRLQEAIDAAKRNGGGG